MPWNMDAIYTFIWNPEFWFPKGYTWKDMEPRDPTVYYPRIRDITLPSLGVAVVLLLIRRVFDKFIVLPMVIKLRGTSRKSRVESHPVLEAEFTKKHILDEETLTVLEKKTSLSKIYIQSWFRRRHLQDTPANIQKISDSSWNFLFYCGAFFTGIAVLWDKPWFAETKYCWKDWPKLHVSNDVYFFYLIELSYYWSMTITLLVEKKKKDFTEMIVHHTATILLIYFSWACNFVRYGSLVILVHDAVDYWMAAAKIAKYFKRQNLCEFLFVMFVIVWCITRLWIYPFSLLYSVTYEIHDYVAPFQSHTLFKTLLYILQLLHFVWTFMILRIAFQKFSHGELQKDVRSDTESDNDTDETEDHVVKENGMKQSNSIHLKHENGTSGYN